MISSIYKSWIVWILLLFAIIEFGSIYSTLIGRIGVIIWIMAFLTVFLESIFSLTSILKAAAAKKSVLTTLVLCFFIFTAMIGTFNMVNSNSETTQEINCAVNNYLAPDFGFRKTCLFGYPARQLFIPALPSLLFGREVLLLNIGGAIFFISGLILFCKGIMKFFSKKSYHDFICSIIISSIFNFYYVNHFLFAYEQSIFPLSFSLAATGLLLSLTHDNFYKNVGLVGILMAYLVFSYTTGLFFVVFTFGALIYLLFRFAQDKREKLFIIAIISCAFYLLLSSLLIRDDIHIFESGSQSINIVSDVTQGFIKILTGGNTANYVTRPFQLVFLIALFIPFFTSLRKYYLFAFIWIIGVFFFSIVSKGYSYYPIDFRLHRSIVIIPVLLVFLGLVVNSFEIRHVKKKYLYALLLFVVFVSGVFAQYNIIKAKNNDERHRHVSFIFWLRDHMSQRDLSQGGQIVFDDSLRDINSYYKNYTSVQDSVQYYLPNFEVCSRSTCSYRSGNRYYVEDINPYGMRRGKSIGNFSFNGDSVFVTYEKAP